MIDTFQTAIPPGIDLSAAPSASSAEPQNQNKLLKTPNPKEEKEVPSENKLKEKPSIKLTSPQSEKKQPPKEKYTLDELS